MINKSATTFIDVPVLDETTDALLSKDECFIGTWEQAPEFLRDNEYIRRGYRINFNTTGRVLKSLFMCHNETTNIWSHLLAAFLFAAFMIYIGGWISFTRAVGIYLPGTLLNSSCMTGKIPGGTNGKLYKEDFSISEVNLGRLAEASKHEAIAK
eukprot:TRINITY_DN7487_c0_g1_i19.p2 TRINITY_DN7487_c0_g1~~TRINITY_DN7487_c0_g1_i19.p2  ORF type:complete len:154 (-),score=38.00 TRINITY_DN7487_c0_g1_i19:649-1110(-)